MKVLQVHNFYQQPGGEDTVFQAEADLMRNNGWTVTQHTVHNRSISQAGPIKKMGALLGTIWSQPEYKAIQSLLASSKPDVCHVHNFFPLISPSVFYACKNNGVPVVMTVHNYRLMCANGLFLRDGLACEECLSTNMFHGIKYGCYKDSKLFTAVTAASYEYHHMIGTWSSVVSKLIALTPFMKEKLIQKGIPEKQIVIKPNFLNATPRATPRGGSHFVFIGRLDRIKGADLIAKAARMNPNLKIKVLGDGPLRDELGKEANIELLGHVSKEEVIKELSSAKAVLLPTRFYEGLPMTIIEAFACGRPVITTNHGPLPDIVSVNKTGWLFEPDDFDSFLHCFDTVLNLSDEKYGKVVNCCLEEFRMKYTSEKNFNLLKRIYDSTQT